MQRLDSCSSCSRVTLELCVTICTSTGGASTALPLCLQVHVRVKIPNAPSKEERELVEKLKELEGKKSKGLFGKFGL